MNTATASDASMQKPSLSSPADTPDEEALWQFVPLASYEAPGLPVRSAANNAWSSFKHFFRRTEDEALIPVRQEAELRALEQIRLEHLVPSMDWQAAAQALDIALKNSMRSSAQALDIALKNSMRSSAQDACTKFVIGQPHAGHAQIVRHWANLNDALLIPPPSYEQILAGDLQWIENWPSSKEQIWVLPNLEHCYLRHAQGLTLVRKLLEAAECGQLGRGIIACDSWAWNYLQRVWPVPRPDALTLQSFDGSRLARLFSSMAQTDGNEHISFLNAATGSSILCIPAEDEQVTPEIIQLAAHCRGNVGTALHYWRERLRTEPEMDEEKAELIEEIQEEKKPCTENVWVSASLMEPVLPAEADEDTLFVLHALLLHGGLPSHLLSTLLPLAQHRGMALLLRLRNAGLVQYRDERWQVPELAYATVRALLRSRDYLTDDF